MVVVATPEIIGGVVSVGAVMPPSWANAGTTGKTMRDAVRRKLRHALPKEEYFTTNIELDNKSVQVPRFNT